MKNNRNIFYQIKKCSQLNALFLLQINLYQNMRLKVCNNFKLYTLQNIIPHKMALLASSN